MKRIYQILSVGFLALVLFLNIGLTLTLDNGLHAHILGNNQILIHLHHTSGGDHSHSSPDCGSSNYVFSSTLTYLNNAQGFTIQSSCVLYRKEEVLYRNYTHQKQHLHTYPHRGPPVV